MKYPKNSLWLSDGEDVSYNNIEKKIGYTFNNRNLCRQAFICEGFANGNQIVGNNEILEFYGDAVIYLFASMYFLKDSSIIEELEVPFIHNIELKTLTELRSSHIRNDYLAECFLSLGLENYVISDKSKRNTKFYGDVMEALIGAVWLDSKFNAELMNTIITNLFSINKPDDNADLACLECVKHWHKVLYGKPIEIKKNNNKIVLDVTCGGNAKAYSCECDNPSLSMRKISFNAFKDMRRKLINLYYSDINLGNSLKTLKEMKKRKIISSLSEEIVNGCYGEWVSTICCDEFRCEYSNSSREKAINRNRANIIWLLLDDADIYTGEKFNGIVFYRTFV